jgi:hypothetical protein
MMTYTRFKISGELETGELHAEMMHYKYMSYTEQHNAPNELMWYHRKCLMPT